MSAGAMPSLMARPLRAGIAIDGHRDVSTSLPVERVPVPAELVLPLQQHIGTPSEPVVAAGDTVERGQLIARSRGFISANLHAPVKGVVKGVEYRPVPHPSGLNGACITLIPDPDPDSGWKRPRPKTLDAQAVANAAPLDIKKRIRAAGIVGLGGATFPTSVKIKTGIDNPIDTLIINGCECEPWITCDEVLMRERPQYVIGGARLIQRAIGAKRRALAIESDSTEAIAALREAIAECNDATELHTLPPRYPAGSEKQLIAALTGREVPSQGLPSDIGAAVYNAGTAVAVYRAVAFGEPLISRFVTVSGPGARRPRVLHALIGTPVRDLLACCGGATEDADGIVMGGSMMGLGIGPVATAAAVPVVKGMNAVLISAAGAGRDQQGEMPCIRCGACAEVCPARLAPQQLYSLIRAADLEQAQQKWHLEDCIECGCCNAVCPSHIPLADYYRYAKSEIRAQGKARVKAQQARQRYEFRAERIERAKHEREEKLRKKKEALQAANKAKARAAMIEEAKALEVDLA